MTQETHDDWLRQLATDTREPSREGGDVLALDVPGVTVLAHPNPRRIGEEATWPSLAPGAGRAGGVAELSRLKPLFAQPTGGEERPLADPHLSRQPIVLHPLPEGGLCLDVGAIRTRVEIDGVIENSACEISCERLNRGVVLLLGGRVALLLHFLPPTTTRPSDFGWVGESPAMVQLRWEVARVASLDLPVLLRGESGTGKELVARALQKHGPTPSGPFLSLNMGAVPASLAAAELFGASRGAYSGAAQARVGYFQQADGGTLFLDEIGETPLEVQALLLRTLESGEIQPLGSTKPRRVRVRILAATDADLEAASLEGRFRAPLLHRLGGYEIQLPPLRKRRADIGRLFCHFLAAESQAMGEPKAVPTMRPDGRPWVAAELLATLARYDWPGNVRQLRNVVRRLLVAQRGRPGLDSTEQLEGLLGAQAVMSDSTISESTDGHSSAPVVTAKSTASSPSPRSRPRRQPRSHYRDPADVAEEELLTQLRNHQYELRPTAEALGISRTSLYTLIERSPQVRTAAHLERAEIEAEIHRNDGSIDAVAATLGVSKHALKRRMKTLGMR